MWALWAGCPVTALAQHATDNAVATAEDAFGLTVGTETVGIYSGTSIRGFDPQQAGNTRIEGLYFDQKGALSSRVIDGSAVHVGVSAVGYSFPAPTGIVDYKLRSAAADAGATAVLYAGPFETRAADLDGRFNIASLHLAVPLGVNYRLDAALPDYTSTYKSVGLAPAWKPNDQVSLRAFGDYASVTRSRNQPLIYATGTAIPPVPPARFFGQQWTLTDLQLRNAGLLAEIQINPRWKVAAGVFHSDMDLPASYADLLTNVLQDGTADHLIVGNPDQSATSESGEIRLSRHTQTERRTQDITLTVRGRDARSEYGGSDLFDAGPARITAPVALAQPMFAYGPRARDSTRLLASGLTYRYGWNEVGVATVGIQKDFYSKSVRAPDGTVSDRSDHPWRFNGAVAIPVGSRWLAYASYTQGLEDAGVAPSDAENRGAILPATRTRQFDAGIQVPVMTRLTLIAGVFDIRKPYFNLAADGQFEVLGNQRRRGAEFSLTGEVATGLHLVAGAVVAKPEVQANSDQHSEVGSRAIGQPDSIVQVSVDYRLPVWPAMSLDAAFSHYGRRAVSLDNQLELGGRSVWDLGARYSLSIWRLPASVRVQVLNVANSRAWDVTEDGGLAPFPGRSAEAYITVDW